MTEGPETRAHQKPTPKEGYRRPAYWIITVNNGIDAYCLGVFRTKEKAEAFLQTEGWTYDGVFWIEPNTGPSLLLLKTYWARHKMRATVAAHELVE